MGCPDQMKSAGRGRGTIAAVFSAFLLSQQSKIAIHGSGKWFYNVSIGSLAEKEVIQ